MTPPPLDRLTPTHRPARARALLWSWALVAGLLIVPFVGGSGLATNTPLPLAAAATCAGPTYTVASGDSWSVIASRAKVTLNELLAANSAVKTTVIHPGQVLCLPASASTTSPPTTSKVVLPSGAVPIAQFPVQGPCWFSNSFGAPRSGGRRHEGVDLIAAQGRYIYAVDDGVLSKQFIDAPGSLSGNGWRLRRPDGTYFVYAHLSAFAPGLGVGSPVVAGQIIGLVGMTGAAGTPHLHFEVHPGGGPAIDPTPTVKAINACKSSAVPPQPGQIPTITTGPATTSAGTAAATTAAPVTTVPKPTTTKPKPKPTTTTAATTTTTEAPTTTAAPTTTTTTTILPQFAGGFWQFVAPITLLDSASSPLRAGVTRTVGVVGRRGLLAGVPAVMVRVTVHSSDSAGDLTLHACNATAGTPTLHYSPGRANAIVTTVRVGPQGFCVTATTDADVRLEVIAAQSDSGVGSRPLDARRALDTRLSSPLVPDLPIPVGADQLAVPDGASAVSLTLTLLDPADAGNLSIGPCSGGQWTLPFTATAVQMVSAVVRVDDAGLCVTSTTAVDVVIDVTGVWAPAPPLATVVPTRLYDSRSASAITDDARRVPLALPDGATTAQLSLTVTGATSGGALWVWNCRRLQPVASVAYTAGAPVSVVITLDVSGGEMCLATSGSLHVLVDLLAAG